MLLLLSLLACADDARVGEILALTPDTDEGSALYATSCTGCHGTDATGGSGPDLVSELHHSDEHLLVYILDGDGDMPSYADWSDQELADLMGYLRSLE
jgi:mono/diheme cytochrome c family protein